MSFFGQGSSKGRKVAKSFGRGLLRKTLAWSHGKFFCEPLEERHMLSVSINPISGPDASNIFVIPSGKDLYVPVIGTDTGQTISYTATSSDPSVHVSVLTGNPTLQLTVHGVTANNVPFSGTMTFQLFENIAPQTVQGIISNVQAGLYNGASFYRSETTSNFQLIQGGIEQTTGKSDTTVLPDEFNVDASFNSSGLLAMANAGPGTATSEFFITAPNRPLANDPQSLNFGYTIFGQILTGLDIYNDILNTPTTSSGGISMANTPITIDSASIITDTQNAVLQISEASSSTSVGSLITVTGTGSDNTSAQQSFSVGVGPPVLGTTGAQPLILAPIANQTTPQNTPVSFQVSATEQSAGTLAFTVTGATTFTGAPANVTVQVTPTSSSTATVTLTPASGFSGTINLLAHVDDSTNVLHDALPLTLNVTSAVSVTAVTTTINASNQTNTSASGTGDVGATISVVASDGTNSTTPATATVDGTGHWSVSGINVTALNDGTVTYTATETAGGTGTGDATATKDSQAPTVVSIVPASTNPTNATSVTYTVTFSEIVTGVTVNDFTLVPGSGLTGASITSVSGGGTTWTVTVNPGNGVGTLGLNLVDDDSITDATGNPLGGTGAGNGNFTGQTFTVNRPPLVNSINTTGNNPVNGSATSLTYTVTFTSSVTGVDLTDFVLATTGTIAGASITNVAGSGTTYTVTVNPGTGEGTIGLNLVDDDSITDAGGNALGGTGTTNGNFIGQMFTIDRTPPTVSSIATASPNPTTATSVTYTVTFSESVTGVTAGDFTLVPSSGITGASITSVTGSGSTWTVTVNPGNGIGTVGLNLVDDDSILDLAGNPLGGTGAGNGNFTGAVYTVNRPPTVSSIVPSGSSPTNATTLTFTVTFSTSVTGVTTNDFTIATTGSVSGASVTGVSGSGSTYSVTVSTGTGSGTLGLNLVDDDSITDASGNPLGGTGTANGNFTGQTVILDKTTPSVVSIVPTDANPTTATTVHFTVTFSESVTGVTANDFTLAASGLTGSAITGVTGSGSTYTVTATVGTGSGTLGLNLIDDDSIVDAVGNPLGGTGAGNGNFTGQAYTISQPQNGSLSGLVYEDMDGTGSQNNGEPGVEGIFLTLTGVDGQGNAIPSQTTTTAHDGSFSFSGLQAGTYTITESQPKSLADGSSVAGTLGGTAATDAISGIVVSAGGSGTGYTFSEGPLPPAQITLDLFLASTQIDQFVDKLAAKGILAPIVTSISKASADPTSASTVNYTVNFDESVTGVDTSDFSLTLSGVTGASVASVSGSGSTYTVTVNTGTGNGKLALSLIDDDSIVSSSGTPLAGSGAGNGNFTGPAYTINVTSTVNHAPLGADKTITTLENTAYTFATSDFGFTDPNDNPANTLSAVEITTLPVTGSLTDNGVAVTAGQFIQVADIAGGLLKFTPAANANGAANASFTFQVQDNGGTANGGVNLDPTTNTITFNVTAVNNAPSGTSNSVTTGENTAYSFLSSDFGFTDASDSPPNNLLAVEITTLPASGSLTDNGVAVTAGQLIAVADITGGLLKFTPATGSTGTPLTTFTFQVEDDGGTANGGVNLDPTPKTLTINVTGINNAPSGTNNTVTSLENGAYEFLTSDFGFSDPNDNPPNNLLAVEITTLPTAGTLTDNGVAVTAGQFIPVADISATLLKFTPAANANGTGYASFTFQVEDDGGTANGGIDLDPTPKTITVNVTAINSAPLGTSKTITLAQDSSGAFDPSDFGFSDPNDSPANTLLAVEITTVPAAGSLDDNGVAVTAGQFIPVADIAGGLLTYAPAEGATGSPYASFTFQVQDNGGTTNGGIDLDPVPKTITLNVVVPNNPPTGADNTLTGFENSAITFASGDFGFSDPDNTPPNNFLAVMISTLPTAGSLTDNGVAVTAGQFVSVTDITAGLLKFTPAANANGTGYASFTFQVQDDGGNVGLDTDPTPKTMTLNITPVNSAPVGTSNTITMAQDSVGAFAPSDFGFSDPNDSPANSLLAVEITALPSSGTLADDGVAVTAGQFIPVADITAGLLTFTPAPEATGSPYATFTFQVQDDGGTANGGVDIDPQPKTFTINVVVPNNPPTGTDNTVTSFENGSYAFAAADFGFSDPDNTPPNNFLAVMITTLPTAGNLTDNGVAVTAGQFVSVTDITAGLLKFTPAANANGAGYATFTFQVQDDGGNVGLDTDPTPKTMTINVTAVNSAPQGADNSITLPEGTFGAFDPSDFGFNDPNDSPANNLLAVKITTLPTAGTLNDGINAVTAGQFIPVADITAGSLTFTPDPTGTGSPYATFTFQVQDDGGTANGGVDLDPTPRTMGINVLVSNNPPVGTDNTLTTLENEAVTFAVADFGFSDPGNTPPNNFQAVMITTVPTAGSLTDSGVAVTAGQLVPVTDITGGLLQFTPATNANGAGYASFTFQVQDDGGTFGLNTDPTPRTMTINVTSVNNAPQGADATITLVQSTSRTLHTSDFGFSDPSDSPGNNLLSVEITTIPTAGSLTDNDVAVTAGQFIPVADITNGLLIFTPTSGATGSPYASFTFQVQDDGGTANGGVDLDPSPNTITFNVTAPNHAPSGADKTVSVLEDTALVFAVSDFGFSDSSDTPANNLLAVNITTLPAAGSLADNGVAVTAGQFIPVADIAGGLLQFTPAANANGVGYASFTFQVQDDGGTVGGGVDLDPTPRTMTIDVTSVNDAPVGTNNTIDMAQNSSGTFSPSDFGFTDPNDTPPNNLLGVVITTVPTAGSLTDNGVAVTAGQFVPVADIAGNLLAFAPASGATGSPYASFTFQVEDDGGTANGGVNLDPTPRTMTFNVVVPNSPPSGADNTLTTLEDQALTFAVADFGFSDTGDTPPNNFAALGITTVPTAGNLTDNGVAVTAGQLIPVADIAGGLLKFTPAANANGVGYASFTFQVQDDGNTVGLNFDPSPKTMTIDVTSVNDAPVGTNNTINMAQNSSGTFSPSDFGFTDPNDTPANNLLGVVITTVPTAGSLTDNGVAVTAGQFVPVADIVANQLAFTPASGATGSPYASFTFQVEDDGGTANGGVNLDPTPRTMTFNVVVPNSPPSGTDNTLTTLEDQALTFATGDFGFSDTGNTPPNNFAAVGITTIPTVGSLTDNGVAVTVGQLIPVADITAGLFKFTPAANANGAGYASYTFQVQDDGGTVGLNFDPSPKTMTIDVTSVNDAPQGADNAITMFETTSNTFVASDFGFSDPHDSPANALLAVKITTVPTAGSLTDNGVAVTAGQLIPVADITASLLSFTPVSGATGSPYASFTFQVQDDGGTTNGGVDLDATPRTMTLNVVVPSSAPVGTNGTVATEQNVTYVFAGTDFGFTDPSDTPPNNFVAVKITTLPSAGTLFLNSVAITAGQLISISDINGGNLRFTPANNATGNPYTTFTFQVEDDGNNPAQRLDPNPKTMTINVTAVVVQPAVTNASLADQALAGEDDWT